MARIALGLAVLLAACGHDSGTIDRTIGAACTADTQCEHQCFQGGDFPGGFCSLSCVGDVDCPADSYCADKAGGVCMYACPTFDCGRLGGGWGCHNVDDRGGGRISVCIGN
jgi:hypothetical protein